jgi:hypothetical protein
LAGAGSIAHVIPAVAWASPGPIPEESELLTSRKFLSSAEPADSSGWIGSRLAPFFLGSIGAPDSTLKIEKHSSHGKTTIRLIGRFQWEHVDELKKQIHSNGKQLALDLQEVTLVDLGVVQFLALCEAEGIDLLHCPPYIREWIRRERQA